MQVCWAVTLKVSQNYAFDVRASSWLVLQKRWPKNARSRMVLLNGRWTVHGKSESENSNRWIFNGGIAELNFAGRNVIAISCDGNGGRGHVVTKRISIRQ